MSNFIEYHDKLAFHPGYYIKEIIENSGLTQEDFAKRLGTTPKNISILIQGKQSLSMDMAVKLSKMLGTSVNYWLNLQSAFDSVEAEMMAEQDLEAERRIFQFLDYAYFCREYGLPNLPGRIDEQIQEVRKFLQISSLQVLAQRDMAVNFRSSTLELSEEDTVRANAMVQIAVNKSLNVTTPRFNKKTFEEAADYALTLTKNHENFYSLLRDRFLACGVVFVILPNLPKSQINGATKRLGKHIMLMVNDRKMYSDSFWFTLFHEIGHIMNGDYGISFEKEKGEQEAAANQYAENKLIPSDSYREFLAAGNFSADSIVSFANQIDRDPGIVLGRLQNDGHVGYNRSYERLRHRYKVVIDY